MAGRMATASKGERISMRVSAAQRDLLIEASRAEDATLSDFILAAATRRAEDILADRRFFALSPERYRAFVAALERPVVEMPRLRKLLTEPSVFDG